MRMIVRKLNFIKKYKIENFEVNCLPETYVDDILSRHISTPIQHSCQKLVAECKKGYYNYRRFFGAYAWDVLPGRGSSLGDEVIHISFVTSNFVTL